MKISPINSQPFYTKGELKSEAHSAAVSAALSAGITYAMNGKGSGKLAAKVGAIGAGISLVLGAIQKIGRNRKAKQIQKTEMN